MWLIRENNLPVVSLFLSTSIFGQTLGIKLFSIKILRYGAAESACSQGVTGRICSPGTRDGVKQERIGSEGARPARLWGGETPPLCQRGM
jgi:hypothetical protein